VIKAISNQKDNLTISQTSQRNIKLKSTKKNHTRANSAHVESSRIGYSQDTLALHCLHFHLLMSQEKRGIRSRTCNSLLQLPQ